jgi:hypothetical protein
MARWRKDKSPTSPIVAAGAVVVGGSAKTRAETAAKPSSGTRATELWDYVDSEPALKFALSLLGDHASRCWLEVQDVDRASGEFTGPTKDESANGVLISSLGGRVRQGELLASSVEQVFVAGECYLDVKVTSGGLFAGRADVYSALDVTRSGDGYALDSGDYSRRVDLNDGKHVVVHVYRPHPRTRRQITSSVAGVLPTLRWIRALREHQMATIDSRLLRDILTWPSEIDLPGDADPDAGSDALSQSLAAFTDAIVEPAQERGSAASNAPIVVSGPSEYLKAIAYVTRSLEPTQVVQTLLEAALKELALGLQLPTSALSLDGAHSANHWSAWATAEELVGTTEFALQFVVASLAEWFADALEENGLDPAAFALTFNSSALHSSPDVEKLVMDATDRNLISGPGARAMLQIPERYAPAAGTTSTPAAPVERNVATPIPGKPDRQAA